MQVTFLESENGVRLTKKHNIRGSIPYPHVKNVTSHEHQIPADATGLAMLEDLIRDHGDKGHCMMKGNLKRHIENVSRAGKTNKLELTNLLVLDVDALTLPNYLAPKTFTSQDVINLAKTVLRELPPEVQDSSFIAQASASLGMKGDKISLHIFILLKVAMPVASVKLWLQNCNYESELFTNQLDLSANGSTLKYKLDISVADNSKLIFVAPPMYEDPTHDPFSTAAERIVSVSGITETLDLAAICNISPEGVFQRTTAHKNRIRTESGFNRKTEKISYATVAQKREEILDNPDRMSISILSHQYDPFITCNVNGGDSGAYYYNTNDPSYMYNFKGEPIWLIEKADPDFFNALQDMREEEGEEGARTVFPVVMRDFKTATYYNGVFDPNIYEFTTNNPLVPCAVGDMDGFMRSHGRTKPDFVPEATVVFDPVSGNENVDLINVPYYINMFKRTRFMKLIYGDNEPAPLGVGDSKQIENACPTIYKLTKHMIGGHDLEMERFINWLAYIFQTREKSGTSWVFQGVPGTGKGVFYDKVLRPLFGTEYVPMKTLQNIEEQYNLYMKKALFLVVDEFHMASANAATIKVADKLKSNITEPMINIRAMRANVEEVKSYTNYIFLTNRQDAVNIEEKDRRYNIAPRQEVQLKDAHPEVIENIPNIKNELEPFARILQKFKFNKTLIDSPIENSAKAEMARITMSVMQEFFLATREGNLQFFLDILDINLTNVMQGQEITTAQRLVKQWIVESQYPHSVIPIEHLRTVYGILTEDRLSPREFTKRAERNGVKKERKREHKSPRSAGAVYGVVTTWQLDEELFKEITDKYFNERDMKLLAAT